MAQDKVTIDGSQGEGGGQILRTAAALAAVTGAETEIVNIRAGRQKPGLQPQHLAAVRAAAAVCGATLDGDTIGSLRLAIRPGEQEASTDTVTCDIGTAGATTLVLQTVLLPCLCLSGRARIELRGGTHVPMAPSADYIEGVFIPAMHAFGIDARMDVRSLGFYPKGGGSIEVSAVLAGPLAPVRMDAPDRAPALRAFVTTAELPDHVAQRGGDAVSAYLKGRGRKAEVTMRRLRSSGPGAAVALAATAEHSLAGFQSLGRRGVPMETVAEDACRGFMDWAATGAACDEHLADQLVLPAALASGESCWTAPVDTEHLRTVLQVVSAVLPITWSVERCGDRLVRIRLRGAPPSR